MTTGEPSLQRTLFSDDHLFLACMCLAYLLPLFLSVGLFSPFEVTGRMAGQESVRSTYFCV